MVLVFQGSIKRAVLTAGLCGGLACASDHPATGPDVAEFELQSSTSQLITIAPSVDGSVRDGNDVGENSVVQTLNSPGMEDRGVIEFDLQKFSGPVLNARLRLNVFGSKGPYPFRVDLYGYRGDGKLQVDDCDRGTFISAFQYAGEESLVLDVTAKVAAMKSGGAKRAGFNFRAEPSDIELNGPFVAFHSNEYPPRAVLVIRTTAP